jgi:hypothetical protein
MPEIASDIQGFDPLSETQTSGGLEKRIAEEAVRREVTNILKSYTGYYDLFSELLQNALDGPSRLTNSAFRFDERRCPLALHSLIRPVIRITAVSF